MRVNDEFSSDPEHQGPSSNPAGSSKLTDLVATLDSSNDIANGLARVAGSYSGRQRRHAQRLSRFFAHKPTTIELMHRPDAMAIIAAWIRLLREGNDLPNIERIWTVGYQDIRRMDHSNARTKYRFLYPLSVLILGGFLVVGYMLFLVPAFDKMFAEFGLNLPAATMWMLGISRFLRSTWPWLLALAGLCATATVAWYAFSVSRGDQLAWESHLPHFWKPRQTRLAQVAMHLALLFESGVPIEEAITIVGRTIKARRIHNQLRQSARVQSPSNSSEFPAPGFGLIAQAIDLSQASESDQSIHAWTLLREAAAIHHDFWQHRRAQWLAWLSPLSIAAVSVFVGLLVAALFLPMISLIRGLSA